MKLSFTTLVCPDWNLPRIIDAAVTHGYKGLEFRCDAHQAHGIEAFATTAARKDAVKRLSDAGLQACCLATSLRFIRSDVFEMYLRRLELCAEVEIPLLRVFCGQPEDEWMSMDDAVRAVADRLREAAELASDARVTLALQTHDHMARAADAAAAVRLAAHPLVALCYDNLHPLRKREPLELTLRAIDGIVRHTHFRDGLLHPEAVVVRPLGQGQLPMDPLFRGLLDIGYDAYLGGEWFDTMYGQSPEESLERYAADMDGLAARHGIKLER